MRELIKVTLQSSTATVIELLLRAVTIKIYALLLGPAGIGLFAILRQIVDLGQQVASLNGSNAIVQGLSSRSGTDRAAYLRTVFCVYGLGFLVVAPVMVFGGTALANWAFGARAEGLGALVPWLALTVLVGLSFGFLTAVTNAGGGYGKLALVRLLVPLILLVLAYPVARLVASGHLITYVLAQVFALACGALFLFVHARRQGWLAPLGKAKAFSLQAEPLGAFFKVTLWLFASTVLASLSALVLRLVVLERLDAAAVGIVDSAIQIMTLFANLLLSPLSLYFLPKLSAASSEADRGSQLNDYLGFTLLLAGPALALLIAAKPLVLTLFYSEAFLPALDLLRWLLPGAFLKVAYWVIGTAILGAAHMRALFLIDLVQYLGFAALATAWFWLTDDVEVIGPAYLIAQAATLMVGLAYAARGLAFRPNRQVCLRFALAVLLLSVISGLTWTAWTLSLVPSLLACGLGLAILVVASSREERRALFDLLESWRPDKTTP